MHLAAQEDHVPVAEVLVEYKAQIDPETKVSLHRNTMCRGYTILERVQQMNSGIIRCIPLSNTAG